MHRRRRRRRRKMPNHRKAKVCAGDPHPASCRAKIRTFRRSSKRSSRSSGMVMGAYKICIGLDGLDLRYRRGDQHRGRRRVDHSKCCAPSAYKPQQIPVCFIQNSQFNISW